VELEKHRDISVRIIHDDFLKLRSFKRYDLIAMNPPFVNGDKHLLKALELQSNGGQIVCLLNAETIRNPHTSTRQLLQQQLAEHKAEIEYVEDAFAKAERRADVDVAIVRVNIPRKQPKSTIYERLKKAAEVETFDRHEETDLVTGDYLEQVVQAYDIETGAGVELIREYRAMTPYILEHFPGMSDYSNKPILRLQIEDGSRYADTVDINDYLQKTRLKYWTALFSNEKFTGNLTSNLLGRYREMVQDMADYDFTMFNIRKIMVEMNANMMDGVKDTIMRLFDKLTVAHSYYPECQSNRHYFDGWKTNKAHKIGKKSIIPTNGMFSEWSNQTLVVRNVFSIISDIEKVFNYLDGGMTDEVDLMSILQQAEAVGQTRNIECKYFKIDLYKKGTTHIKFTNPKLVEKLNIYAARNRNWLPPNYGHATYAEMQPEEQAVVNGFQGKAAYAEVLERKEYYLAEPTQAVAMLTEGGTA
jgi:hypothetical protein